MKPLQRFCNAHAGAFTAQVKYLPNTITDNALREAALVIYSNCTDVLVPFGKSQPLQSSAIAQHIAVVKMSQCPWGGVGSETAASAGTAKGIIACVK